MSVSRKSVRLAKINLEAEGYLELDQPKLALKALERIGELVDFDDRALLLMGYALHLDGRFLEALDPLEVVVRINHENLPAWFALGWCYKRVGRVDLAAHALENACRVAPLNALVHYNLACYLSLLGQKSRCVFHLSRALALDPELREHLFDEPDFRPMRDEESFLALTSVIV